MTIALVILHADPARGGAERYTVDLAAALARRGHDVHIIATSFSDEVRADMRVPLETKSATRVGRYRRFLDALDAHLIELRYDIVHAMLPVRRCDVYHPHAGMASEAMRRWSSHLNPRRRAMAAVEARLLYGERPPIVLCLSEYSKRDVLKHYQLENGRLMTLFNAVDLERFRPGEPRAADIQACGSSDVVGLIIANDFTRKGLSEAIRATAAVKCPELRLVVLGKQDVTLYQREAERLKARVEFAGPVADPRPYYDAADFFVLPTKHDPCSLVVLEALAMGVPVISTKFNGACEIMTSGVQGYILDDPHDVAALAQAMRWMMDSYHRVEFSKACLELRPKLSYEHHLDELVGIYQSIIDDRRRPR